MKCQRSPLLCLLLVPLALSCGRRSSSKSNSGKEEAPPVEAPADTGADTDAGDGDEADQPPSVITSFRDCSQDAALLKDKAARGDVLRKYPGFHFYGSSQRVAADMDEAGFKIFHVDTNALGSDAFSKDISPSAGTFDFSELDERVKIVLTGAPTACLVLRIELSAPTWWKAAHNADLERLADGSTDHVPVLGEPVRSPSLASAAYRADLAQGLAKLTEHVASMPWKGRVLSLIFTGLFSQEFYPYDSGFDSYSNRVPKHYSSATVGAFREWLQKRYETEAALRLAWGQPTQTFAGVAMPMPAAFSQHLATPATGSFRSLPSEGAVVDALAFRSSLTVDFIGAAAHAVRGSPMGDRILGALYGYVNEFQGQASFGHHALGQLIANPDVDLVLNEASYQQREAVVGVDLERGPSTSVVHAGKILMIDNDQGTFLSEQILHDLCEAYRVNAPDVYNGSSNCTHPEILTMWLKSRGVEGLDSAALSDGLLKRFAGFALSKGIAFNVFSIWGIGDRNDFSDPALWKSLREVNQIMAKAPTFVAKPAEILIVTDESSNDYTLTYADGAAPSLASLNTFRSLPAFARIGAPVDHVLLGDLAKFDLAPYKLIVFLNAIHLDNATRNLLAAKVKVAGKTSVWVGGAGWLNREYPHPNQPPADVVGIQIAYDLATEQRSPTIQFLPAFGGALVNPTVSPGCCARFYVADGAAETMGSDPSGGLVTAAKKTTNGHTAVWLATADLPASTWRRLAKDAGAHIYQDSDDASYFGPSTLTLTSSTDATHTVTFPYPVDVVDLDTGKSVGSKVETLSLPMQRGATALWSWQKSAP